jgi:RNA polymerase sigma-70 factor (ECF subfamily)
MVLANKRAGFERAITAHLPAAYNLARWLTRNGHDAEDVVQESIFRAYKFFDDLRGSDMRSWFLKIVRNTGYTWLKQNRPGECVTSHVFARLESVPANLDSGGDPEVIVLRKAETGEINDALAAIPAAFREVIVLRELEALSYKEIAAVIDAPIGTVMSRLARARAELRRELLHTRSTIQRRGTGS